MSCIKIADLAKEYVPSMADLDRIKGGFTDGTSNTLIIGEGITLRPPRGIVIKGSNIKEN